jgi:LysR family transcriptional regulator, transcriptional activator of the cysJI operon
MAGGDMDLHHLKVFQAAARTCSFTAAGRELSLSQSTVSLHIKQIEEEFGCVLFLRTKKRLYLSEAGRVLQQHAERTLAEFKDAELAVREFSTSQRGIIRLGVGATTLIYLFSGILSEYRRRYPLIEILIVSGTTEVLIQGLLDHTVDLAVVMSPSKALESVKTIPLRKEELVIVLDPAHPLVKKAELTPRDLKSLTFISHLRSTGMQILQQFYMDRLGVSPRVTMELENIEAIKSLVAAGMGAALLPLCCVAGPQGHNLAYKKIHNFRMYRQLLLAVTDWRPHPPATRGLARYIIRTLGTKDEGLAEKLRTENKRCNEEILGKTFPEN